MISLTLLWQIGYESSNKKLGTNSNMGASNNYPIDIVKCTKLLLSEHTSVENQVTFLLNCLLGIIVAANEFDSRKKNKKFQNLPFPNELLCIIPENIIFFDRNKALESVTINRDYTSWPILGKVDLSIASNKSKYDFSWFLRKIRNSIAHQHIEPKNIDGNWKGIKMWNTSNDGAIDFEVEFSATDLKELALSIATIYLNYYDTQSGD